MKNRFSALTLAIAVPLCLSACVVTPPHVDITPPHVYFPGVVMEAPPAPIVENMGPPPGPDVFWLSGYWGWQNNRHVWMPGHWEPRRQGQEWVPHSWVRNPQGGGWVLRQGYWRNGNGGGREQRDEGRYNRY